MTMKQRRLFAALLLAALAALALVGPASAAKIGGADQGGRSFSTVLTGEAEVNDEGVPNQGDLDGTGSATISVNPGQGEVCYELSVEDIMLPAIGAHIHVGDAGENGPVVVPLAEPDASGVSSGCEEVSRELALAIIQDPEGYYVNVHTEDFPNGAIRGQLSK
jgi:CHRD domain